MAHVGPFWASGLSFPFSTMCANGLGLRISPTKLRDGLLPGVGQLPHADSQAPPLPLLQSPELTLSQKIRAKLQNPDLLELCHSVPKEVVQLGESREAETPNYLCFGIL